MLIRGFFKNASKSTFSLWAQTEDLVLESQINYHFENFPNWLEERKRPRSTLLLIDLNKFCIKKKKKQSMTCTNTIRKLNSSNFHNPSKEDWKVQQIHKTYILQNRKINT